MARGTSGASKTSWVTSGTTETAWGHLGSNQNASDSPQECLKRTRGVFKASETTRGASRASYMVWGRVGCV